MADILLTCISNAIVNVPEAPKGCHVVRIVHSTFMLGNDRTLAQKPTRTHVRTHAPTHPRTHARTHAHVTPHAHAHTRTRTHTHVHSCMHVRTFCVGAFSCRHHRRIFEEHSGHNSQHTLQPKSRMRLSWRLCRIRTIRETHFEAIRAFSHIEQN